VAASFSCRLVDPCSPGGSPSQEETTASSMFYQNYSRDVFLIRRSELESSRVTTSDV
jgi:speckle-type POZ protein